MPRNIERDKREADRRKNQLIEAGFRLFSQNGIETVSLQKVADAANVSPATMYKYFLTKEKLLIAISAKVWDEVWQEALGDPGTNHFEHFTPTIYLWVVPRHPAVLLSNLLPKL